MTIKNGVVFDIKKFAIDDGPGIRTTIFFKGCPLRCWWCHNPEGQESGLELMYRRNRCVECGVCVKNCPKGAILSVDKQVSVDRKLCSLCGRCFQECPTDALTIVGKKTTVEEVMKEIDRDLIFYEESEGGVTFSGGEPLLQLDFLDALLKECKNKNIRTAVDTNGYATHRAIDRIMNEVDLFLYDIKVMNDRKHRKYTGVSNKPILENFQRIAENGNDILVRFPVIPGINDDEDNLTKTAEFVLSHGMKHVCLLPYHRSGIEKYKNLGKTYKLEKLQAPSDQDMKLLKEKLETSGLIVRVGG